MPIFSFFLLSWPENEREIKRLKKINLSGSCFQIRVCLRGRQCGFHFWDRSAAAGRAGEKSNLKSSLSGFHSSLLKTVPFALRGHRAPRLAAAGSVHGDVLV